MNLYVCIYSPDTTLFTVLHKDTMRQFRFSWLIRHRKYVVSGFLVLILVGILTVSITNSSTNDQSLRHDNDKMITNNDIDIYDDFIEQERQFTKKRPLRDTKPRAALSPDQKEFVNNRIRTLKTILGAVVLKDYLFTPRYPGLWKGYSKKKSDLKRLLSSDWDSDKHEGAEQNSNSLEQKPDSDVIKNLLGDFKQKEVQESRLKRKKLDPKARLQNTAMKLAALYAKLSSKNKDFNRTLDKDPNNAHNSLSQGDCNKPLCVEYLTSQDADQFQYCTKKAKLESSIAPQVSVCHFMNGTKRNSVALAGYPASGHTQVSQLLQHVTGLCTGGINCDITLRRNGFPGESIVSGAVLVVRTIEPEPHWTGLKYKSKENVPVFGSAIYLIRNPLKAMSEVWMSEKVEPGKQ